MHVALFPKEMMITQPTHQPTRPTHSPPPPLSLSLLQKSPDQGLSLLLIYSFLRSLPDILNSNL